MRIEICKMRIVKFALDFHNMRIYNRDIQTNRMESTEVRE